MLNIYALSITYTIPGGRFHTSTIEAAESENEARATACDAVRRDHLMQYGDAVTLERAAITLTLEAPTVYPTGRRLEWRVCGATITPRYGRVAPTFAVVRAIDDAEYAEHCYECRTCRREDCVHIVAVDVARAAFEAADARICR